MKLIYKYVLGLLILCVTLPTLGQDKRVSIPSNNYISGKKIFIYNGQSEDPEKIFTSEFQPNTTELVNLGISNKQHWLKVYVKNNTSSKELELEIPIPYLDEIRLFDSLEFGSKHLTLMGEVVSFSQKESMIPYPVFSIQINPDEERVLLFGVKSSEQLIFPIKFKKKNQTAFNYYFILLGVFLGVFVAMFFYNLILFFNTKSKSYLLYILYLLSVFVTQSCVVGLSHFLFSNSPSLLNASFYIGTCFVGIFGPWFIYDFLKIRNEPKWITIVIRIFYVSYALSLFLALLKLYTECYVFLQINGILISIFLLYLGIRSIKAGNPTAKYFVVAWSLFLLGVIVFVLKDYNLIPFTKFTMAIMPIGATLETILLSVALAHQINTLKKDNEMTHLRVVQETEKNKELILNQNINLENKVKERTAALQQALDDLKATQSQLVQSEKMASLGTLTAGIAHEINNPINFVSANVIPLRENIHDITKLIAAYKSIDFSNLKSELKRLAGLEEELELDYMLAETEQLIDGIEEGARRTHTIVDGLTSFSRGDMVEKSEADINRGIRSTVSVLKSRLNNVKLIMSLDKNLPLVSCQVGKINQVVLNLINNALDALEEKNGTNRKASELTVETIGLGDSVQIIIGDNANGIDEELQRKIMEPFFTTKEVGKGTGLGLSISYSIIKDHGGTMELDSEEGVGTKFIITLPLVS
ncbi:MAG: two-component system NtrC family sensor kinase [Bacteroidia bacterium]|jgi:two-component system NtrC family sensor kinase